MHTEYTYQKTVAGARHPRDREAIAWWQHYRSMMRATDWIQRLSTSF